MDTHRFRMPALGESVDEATVTKWLKQVGDSVTAGEILVEVATDKVDMEVESDHSGIILELLVLEGETVPSNTEIAVLNRNHDTNTQLSQPKNIQETVLSSPVSKDSTRTTIVQSTVNENSQQTAPIQLGTKTTNSTQAAPPDKSQSTSIRRNQPYLTLLVRNLAREYGVDPRHVNGHGRDGRVTKSDMLHAIEEARHADHPRSFYLNSPEGSFSSTVLNCSTRLKLISLKDITQDFVANDNYRDILLQAIMMAFKNASGSAPLLKVIKLELVSINAVHHETINIESVAGSSRKSTLVVRVLGPGLPTSELPSVPSYACMALSFGSLQHEVVAITSASMAIQTTSAMTLSYREGTLNATETVQFAATLAHDIEQSFR